MTARRVIVTGAAGHLGEAIAVLLAARGHRIAAWDRNPVALAELAGRHPDWFIAECELTDSDAVAAALAATVAQCGSVDALVNNAGLIHSEVLFNLMGPAGQRRHSIDTWQRTLDANLTSSFVATSHVVEQMVMKRTRGVIVNISSIAAGGNAGQSAYAAAKAGIEALTVTWARELGAMGIRVVAVAPGFIDTPSTRLALKPPVLDHIVKQTPLRQLGSMNGVAQTVAFALDNEDLTGCVIGVDGGLRI